MVEEPRFTIEEISIYLHTQDSLGDIHYNLSAENIERALDDYSKGSGSDSEE